MAEWSIAPVLKTGDPQGSVGSNPTPSATSEQNCERRRLAEDDQAPRRLTIAIVDERQEDYGSLQKGGAEESMTCRF
jgi:hypothetical protein